MNFRQLRYFLAVAETLNFRKAAERLHMTQPPLSRTIRLLEDSLGCRLFERDARRVRLTEAGRLLLPHATALLEHMADVVQVLNGASDGEGGSLRVGVGIALADSIRSVVVEHASRFPKVDVQCADLFSTYQIRALLDREIDVGFMRPPVDCELIATEFLFHERFVVVVSEEGRLSKSVSLRLHEIADEILLLPKRAQSVGMHDRILELYRRAGLTPRAVHTQALPQEAGALLVAAGKGIYIVPAPLDSLPSFGRGLIGVPLDEPGALIDVYMSWRKKETSAVVLSFLETARGVFRRPG